MKDNVPKLGERVIYYTSDVEFTYAIVIGVTYWDLVDLELCEGVRVLGVRRVVVFYDEGKTIRESLPGRFARLDGD